MRSHIFVSILLCLALKVQAQATQHIDSVPSVGNWVIVNSGTTSQINSVSWPTRDTVWASAQSGLLQSTDGGWTWSRIAGIAGTIIFKTGSDGILAGSSDIIYHTKDAGKNWDTLRTGLAASTPIIAWPSPDTLFATDGYNNQYCSRSTDGGITWIKQNAQGEGPSTAIGFGTSSIGYIVGDAQDCLDGNWQIMGALLLKTTTAGAEWDKICNTMPQGWFWSVACYDANTALMGSQGCFFRTTDGGLTWDSIPNGISVADPIYSIALHDSLCYAVSQNGANGSDNPILMSSDSGKTWLRVSVPIPNSLPMSDVKIFDDTDVIIVGDSGTILRYSTSASGVSQPTKYSLILSLFPNPAEQSITVEYSLPKEQQVTLTILDEAGNTVAILLRSILESAGTQSISFNTANLPSGSYICRLTSESYSATGPLSVIH